MPISSEVNSDLLWKHLEAICQWERYTGTSGENEAAAYIERELTALGIEVVVHEFDSFISHPGKTTLDILGAGGEHFEAITAAFGASTGEADVTGDAVYVGDSGPRAGITGDPEKGGGGRPLTAPWPAGSRWPKGWSARRASTTSNARAPSPRCT